MQTSSLVTLRNGNELSLDFSVVEHEGANVVAVASMVGGLGGDDAKHIEVINPSLTNVMSCRSCNCSTKQSYADARRTLSMWPRRPPANPFREVGVGP